MKTVRPTDFPPFDPTDPDRVYPLVVWSRLSGALRCPEIGTLADIRATIDLHEQLMQTGTKTRDRADRVVAAGLCIVAVRLDPSGQVCVHRFF
jgi:hypothetical protein